MARTVPSYPVPPRHARGRPGTAMDLAGRRSRDVRERACGVRVRNGPLHTEPLSSRGPRARGAAVLEPQGPPGGRPDDPVDHQPGTLLEVPHPSVRPRTEVTVDGQWREARVPAVQCLL